MVDLSTVRFAFAHDWLIVLRGSELVLDRIVKQFGPAPLYTLMHGNQPLSPAIDACPIHPSVLQGIPGSASWSRRALFPLMPWAISRINLAPCDVLISSSSCVAKSIRPPTGAKHICYCHTPLRYVWSQPDLYRGRLYGVGLRLARGPFRAWDQRTASRVDSFIAPSSCVAQRIKESYGRSAVVIAPPVRTNLFTPDASVQREDFWLVAAALEPVKKVELAIEAANERKHRLVIAGSGSREQELKRRAGPTVEFVGQQSAEGLRNFYRRARVFLNLSVEDFGIAPVEALACGCPVVAFGKGGALDIVTDDTGVLFPEQSAASLLAGIDELERKAISPTDCRKNAERFSEAQFDDAMREHVREVLA